MRYDVAIIGGGLAGCSAAIHLTRQGFRVVLCEASDYPHHKVCGEFMSPGCRSQLSALGINNIEQEFGAVIIECALVSTPDGTYWQTDLPGAGIGISRYRLDELLAQTAQTHGVDLLVQTAVTHIEGSLQDGFTLQTRNRDTLEAQAVIGAYGKRSTLDRALDRPFLEEHQPFVGLKQHMANMPMPHQVELHTFDGGYCGISPIENGLTNVCLLVRENVFRQYGEGDIEQFIQWMQSQNPLIAERLKYAEPVLERWLTIAQIPFMAKDVVHNDILMTGDAAGMITPLTGDGMEIALESGALVAEHLADYLQHRRDAQLLLTDYQQAWAKTFKSRIRLGQLSQFFMLRPAWLHWVLRTFRTVPPLGDFFIRHTRHVEPSPT
jgi:menaquinone-9 beta-reductase